MNAYMQEAPRTATLRPCDGVYASSRHATRSWRGAVVAPLTPEQEKKRNVSRHNHSLDAEATAVGGLLRWLGWLEWFGWLISSSYAPAPYLMFSLRNKTELDMWCMGRGTMGRGRHQGTTAT